uniref:DUF4781 domain-containing protein n=1 Tax=Panagrellus redivivus TaxID=6233 RepID=A0A7E4VCQ9_PANRE
MSGDTEPYPLPPFPKNPIWSWGTPAEWRKNAVAAQNDFYGKNGGIMFNKMENYSDIETEILVKAFASNPKTIRTLASSMNMWYSKSERKIAIKMRSRIQARSKSESVLMNAVYVMSYLKEGVSTAVPVFYFQAADGTVSYIDLSARIYKSWKHFLESNVIDPSLCCYPVKGHYGQVQSEKNPPFDDKIPLKLEISESPSCGIVATGIRWTKTAFTYTTYIVMGASILLTAGSSFSNAKWITKLNAIAQKSNKYLQYANSAATVAFSIVSINDKLSHGGEFGGIVAETSLIVSNLVSVLTPAIQKQIITRGLGGKDLAEAGFSDLSPMAKMFLYMLSVSRCVTSCISVLSCVGAMLMKYMYGGTITATDYFHLASSLYTCYGAVTSPLTAKKIFEQVQQEHKMEIARNAKRSEANKATEAEAKQDAAATLKDGKTDANVDKTVDKASAQNDGTEADKHAKEASAGASVLAAAIAGGVLGKGADNGDNKADSGNGGVDGPEEPPNPSKDQNDPVDEDVGLRKEIVSTEDQKIAKKEERERLEAEFEEKYKDDEEAKAGFEYYKTNILAGLDANDYVVNDQLVRLIKTADDPKELFCELAFTKTTITIHRDVLLINGQLNIDGAAFSSYTNHGTTDIGQRLLAKIQAEKDGVEYVETGQQVSNRETILHTTAAINGAPTPL